MGSLGAADDRLVLFHMFVLVLITFLSATLVTRLETSGQAIPDYLRFTPVTWPNAYHHPTEAGHMYAARGYL